MVEWVVAFVLVMYQGVGDDRRSIAKNLLHFRSVDDCNYFAKQVTRTHGNYEHLDLVDPRDRVTAYCLPKAIDPSKTKVY
jgi:phosphoribulokinase